MTGGFNFCFHIEHADFPPVDGLEIVPFSAVMARGKTLLDETFPMEQARAAVAEWKSIRPFFLGDLHLLFPVTAVGYDWAGWQFHRTDLNAGIALVFRRHASPFPTAELDLCWIDPQSQYEISLSPGYEPAPASIRSGAELANISLCIPEKPGSLLVRYKKVESS